MAQTNIDWIVQPLLNLGVTGIVLGWLMLRVETRMRSIENASNRQTRAILMLVIRMGDVNDTTSREAKGIIREIDQAERRGAVAEEEIQ